MAVRFKPFAHWSPKWGAAATGAGVAGLAALAFAGEGQALRSALLAGARGEWRAVRRGQVASELGREPDRCAPAAGSRRVALGGCRHQPQGEGSLAERSLSKLLGGSEREQGLVEARRGPARGGRGGIPAVLGRVRGGAQEETITLPQIAGGEPVQLKVCSSPRSRQPVRVPDLANRGREGRGEGETWRQRLDSLPVPALSIAKDLSVQAASAAFEQLSRQFPRWRPGVDALPHPARQAFHPRLAQGRDREGG